MKIVLPVVFVLLFVSVFLFADARSISPFSFNLAEEIEYNDLYFYVEGGKTNIKVDNGESVTFPILIKSSNSGTTIDFHTTIGNDQMGPIKFPHGTNIQLEPNQLKLDGTDQILNITIHVSDNAHPSKYDVSLVGVWNEEGKISDFTGTSFSLHVGRDFGDNAIPVNFLMPPLKFAKEGISPEEIPCRNDFILILKYDDSPVCVKEETKLNLIERRWMKMQVDVLDDDAFIEGTKKLDSVQYFLSLYPNAEISIDKEWYTITYAESGFIEQDSSRHDPIRTKKLAINLDYDGKLVPYMIECGGPISLSIHELEPLLEHLHNPDWCFPFDQSQFDSLDKKDLENEN